MYVLAHLEANLMLTQDAALDNDEGDHQEQMKELIKQTASSIDDLALKMLFVTVQQNNLDACMQYAVMQ